MVNWLTYTDPKENIKFQYPSDWTVSKEGKAIIRVSPPNADKILSDMDVDSAIYGVRIMPLNPPYPAFPVNLTSLDVHDHLARINTFFFQKDEIKLSDGSTVTLVYNIEHDNRSMLALKSYGDKTLEIEIGHYFPGTRSISDMVGFWGIVATLDKITAQEAKALVQN